MNINKGAIDAFQKEAITDSIYNPPRKRVRSSRSSGFDLRSDCFFCGQEADAEKEKESRKVVRRRISYVVNRNFKESIINMILKQKNGFQQRNSIYAILDLVEVQAKYHVDCYNCLRRPQWDKKTHPQIS